MQNYNSSSSMISNEQQFGIHGISKAYFDNTIKNGVGAYTSANDLYHIGSNQLNQSVTIGSFLNEFNSTYGTNLPIFDAGYVDTSRSVISNGLLSFIFLIFTVKFISSDLVIIFSAILISRYILAIFSIMFIYNFW